MKIGLVAGLGLTIDAFFLEMIAEWRTAGHEVCVATSDGTPRVAGSAALSSLSRNPHPRNLRAPGELRRWVAETGVDVVVTNTATSSFLVRLGALPVPVVYFCHGLHWSDPERLGAQPWVLAERWALRRTDGVICLNSDDHAWFVQHSRVPLLTLAAGVGLDLEAFPRTPPAAEPATHLVWIGEMSDRKRPLDALEVVDELRDTGIQVTLAMLGDGPLSDRVERMVVDRGLEGLVSLEGRRPPLAYMQACHALLHTARWEGLPRVGLEAAAVGRPTIAYDTKGTRDLPGVVVAPDENPASLARTVHRWVEKGRPHVPLDPQILSSSTAARAILDFLTRLGA